MRVVIAGVALLLMGGGCAAGVADQPSRGDPVACLAAFQSYDRAVRNYPANAFGSDDAPAPMVPAPVSRPAQALVQKGCRTSSADLDGLPTLAARLAGHQVVDSGAPIPPTVVHLGIVTGIEDERAVTQFFRGLGYQSRGIGAPTLGRRLYIGTFTSQGALDEAMAIAREAGFVAPMATTRTKL
ncbi:MAG: hypothetical protein QM699_00470 [Amaricoccus sp.]|uniref:hypothetical protein n=1 Tax=Amaricoccus sp. TaxID=1872485 RepID=UPI0039E3F275